jgi:hypothetical protein
MGNAMGRVWEVGRERRWKAKRRQEPNDGEQAASSLGRSGGGLSSSSGGGHQVQGGSRFEPLDLSGVEGVGDLNLVDRAVLVLDLDVEVLALGKVVEAEDRDLVGRLDKIVVGLVGKPEREHASARWGGEEGGKEAKVSNSAERKQKGKRDGREKPRRTAS